MSCGPWWGRCSTALASQWVPTELRHHLSEIAEILFFLLGAMVIVELIDAHQGFSVVTERITTLSIVTQLFLPSLLCLLVPLLWLSLRMKGEVQRPEQAASHFDTARISLLERQLMFVLGIGALVFVPVFKTVTHLPPYMGILMGLGVLWVVTGLMHHAKEDEQRHPLTVAGVLRRIDTPRILFFLGILLAVSALSTAGHLTHAADWLRDGLGNVYAINLAIGLLSAVVDNVPLVAGAMKMYPLLPAEAVTGPQADWLQHFVQDGTFWEMFAYCAGTGGSCLIIGSAAGVAAMGMEKIRFGWYLRHISGLALMGDLAGAGLYILLHTLGQVLLVQTKPVLHRLFAAQKRHLVHSA